MSDKKINEKIGHDAGAEKNKAALESFMAAIFLTGIKLGAGLYTNSLGLFSEAMHSGIDLLAAGLTMISLRIAAMPADDNHQYGHGKAENLSALAQTALLLLTCGWIIGEAIERLAYNTSTVSFSFLGVAVIVISIVVDFSRSRMLRKVAARHNSQALEADALHFTTDIWSSVVVLFGLLALWLSELLPEGNIFKPYLHKADALAALAVSVIVLKAGYDLSKKAIYDLMDGGKEERGSEIKKTLEQIQGIKSVKKVRLRGSGPMTFVELALGVDPWLKVEDGKRIAEYAKKSVSSLFNDKDVDVSIQVEPDSDYMPERGIIAGIHNSALKHGVSVHSIQLAMGEKLHVEIHVETPGDMPLAKAHELVSAFEKDAASGNGGPDAIEIVTHLEPKAAALDIAARKDASEEEVLRLRQVINSALPKAGNFSDCHRLKACRLGSSEINGEEKGPLSVSFHCRLPGETSVAEAHNSVTKLEHILRRSSPEVGDIVIHMEPSIQDENGKQAGEPGQSK